MSETARILHLDSVDNVRDIGGYDTVDGQKLAMGRLFRAPQFHNIKDSDKAKLDTLGIKLICDLRTPSGRERAPLEWPTKGVEILTSDKFAAKGNLLERFLNERKLTEKDARAFMTETYANMPFDPGHVELFSGLLKHMSQGLVPAMILSAGGKDRVGLFATLTLIALGVSREVAISDYLLTHVVVDPAAEAAAAIALLEERGFSLSSDAAVALLGADRRYIEAALDAIRAKHGTVYGYLREVIGLDFEESEALRKHLLA